MSHVQSPIDRPARRTKAELAVQAEMLKRRVAELEKAAVDRIRVDDALRMSEARLRAIMDHAPTEIFLVDREGRYVLVNKEFERRYGLTEKQVVGKTMADFFPADITAEFTAQDRETFETGRAMVKEQVIEYGGVVHTDLEIKFPIVDLAGKTVGVGGIATDITDRKKAEAALQRARDELELRVKERTADLELANQALVAEIAERKRIEQALRQTQFAFDRASDAAFWLNRDGRLVVVNDRACEMLGFSRDELLGSTVADVDPDVRPGDYARAWERIKTSRPSTFEARHRTKDGGMIPVEVSLYYVKHGDEELACSFSRDITERKRAEVALRQSHDELEQRVEERTSELHEANEALRESERRYREIFEESPIGIWEEDWSEAKLFVDKLAKRGVKDFRRYFARRPERAREIYGLITVADASRSILELYGVPDLAALRELFPPMAIPDDNVQGVLDTLHAFLEGKMEREYEIRNFRADGTEFSAHLRAVMPPHRRHDWSRVIYAIDDVTERKRADEALRESEQRFQAMVDHAPAVIAIKDLQSRYLMVNRQFVENLGLSGDRVRGKGARNLYDKDLANWIIEQDRRVIETRQPITFEFQGPYTDATYLALKFPIFGADDEVTSIGVIETDITEQRRVEQALRDSEARLRSILDHSPATVCLKDNEGRYLLVNKRFEELHGVTNEQVVGRTAHDLFPPEIADSFTEHDADVVNTGLVIEREQSVLTADGVCPFAEVKFPVLDPVGERIAIGLIGVDITERKRAEEALRESEAMLAKAQRIGELGFSIWDEKEGREVYCSRTGAEIFGVPEGTLCDNFEDFLKKVHPDDRARVEAVMEMGYEDCAGYEIEYRAVRPDGTSRTVVERTECEFDDEGRLTRTVSTLQDITERKRVEDEMHRYQAELAHVSRLNMLGEMTAGLAHELNQPLAVISSYAQGCLSSIEDGKDAPETLAGALQHIVSQSARASKIIRRIRGFIRKDRRPKSRIDVNAVIGVAIDLLKGETGANGVAIRTDFAEPSPTAVVDDIEFQQVILNLARNSIEIMASQGSKSRELHIRTATSSRTSDEGVGQVEISVQDTGPGVPPEIRDHIFEPFFTTKSQGLGLGLSICRSIIDRHDGNLWLGGDGGTGADFRFTLPLGAREDR